MKRRSGLACIVLACFAALLASTPAALADSLNLSLLSPLQGALVGQTLSFSATVSAPSTNSAPEFLNADSFSISSPLTLDDTSYITTFPLDLLPGQSYTGVLFTVFIPYTTKDGLYAGSFSILGGSTDSSVSTLATVPFDVNVTPEPSTFVLLGTGITAIAAALIGRKFGSRRSTPTKAALA